MALDDVGILNARWGICGFTSSLYAVYNNKPGSDAESAAFKKPSAVLAEIKRYLEALKTAGRQTLLDDIETFTKSFPGFEHFSMANYLNQLGSVLMPHIILNQENFSIGMPPHAVVDYLQRMCGFPQAELMAAGGDAKPEKIIGVFRTSSPPRPYGGLAHYFYYKNGTWYSWGKQFGNLADASKEVPRPYDGISHYISLKP